MSTQANVAVNAARKAVYDKVESQIHTFEAQLATLKAKAEMQAAMLSYSRSRGLFAGLALKGVVIKPADDLSLAVYNKTVEELLKESADIDATSDLEAFRRALNRYTGQS